MAKLKRKKVAPSPPPENEAAPGTIKKLAYYEHI
jgi:hypothetical protein